MRPTWMPSKLDSDLRASYAGATIGGAYRHPGLTHRQARGTIVIRPLCQPLKPVIAQYFHDW